MEKEINNSFYLVGLGDSLVKGFGMNNENDMFIGIVNNYLMDKFNEKNIILANKAVNGQDSTEFLNSIKNDVEIRNIIKKTNLIILSIGGNDYLKIFNYIYATNNINKFKEVGINLIDNLHDIFNEIFSLNKNVYIILIPLYNPHNTINKTELLQIFENTKMDIVDKINNYSNKQIYILDDLNDKFQNGDYLMENLDPHPNKEGHNLIANECIKIIDKIFN